MRIPGVVYVLSGKEESYKTRRPLGSGVDLGVGRGYWSRGNWILCSARDKTFLMPLTQSGVESGALASCVTSRSRRQALLCCFLTNSIRGSLSN